MPSLRSTSTFRAALIALPLLLGGCETLDKLNPFEERQTPLPGDRKPLFPGGVPGVEFGAAPPQPSNQNVPIPPQGSAPAQTADEPRAEPAPRTQTSARPQPAQKSARRPNPNDAWEGTR